MGVVMLQPLSIISLSCWDLEHAHAPSVLFKLPGVGLEHSTVGHGDPAPSTSKPLGQPRAVPQQHLLNFSLPHLPILWVRMHALANQENTGTMKLNNGLYEAN